jgi:hypothetical protein
MTSGIASPDVADGEPLRERVVVREHVIGEAGDPRPAADGRHDGGIRSHGRFFQRSPLEDRPEESLVMKVFVRDKIVILPKLSSSKRAAAASL